MQRSGGVQRLRLRVHGAVQGVGFRPCTFRLADQHRLAGWIANDPSGVILEVEGEDDDLTGFVAALRAGAPVQARIESLAIEHVPVTGETGFRILPSASAGTATATILPDLATCPDCLADVVDEGGRRRGYAFTNCTNCGPRYSIIRGLPYDRPATTMASFVMCPSCEAEYRDPRDRRFHAQPNACPACGPQLALWDASGRTMDVPDALDAAAAALLEGRIVAVKGMGGFHLMADATNERAVARLRRRKRRPVKPLAVMVASVAAARCFVEVSDTAAALLESAEAPIVLLPRRGVTSPVAPDGARQVAVPVLRLPAVIAPSNPDIGVMLAATPLHHLLTRRCGVPLVATSGNISEEPICTDEREAVDRLGGVADLFLVHDRSIERHVDDSVADIVGDTPRLLRRARGYAPLPVRLAEPVPSVLATGAHMKNTVALTVGHHAFLSQHIGDLDTLESRCALERVSRDLLRLYGATPVAIAHDMHPDYASTSWAERLASELGVPAVAVQHHHAHLVSCMAENGTTAATLGVAWDGTGYGTDGTIWGGEFLLGDAHSFSRVAHLLPFRLAGGDAAVREPRRTALALLHAALGANAVLADAPALPVHVPAVERNLFVRMIERGINAPETTSAGRLFDGLAALLGLCNTATFEGEAAIRLEHALDPREAGAYEFLHIPGDPGGTGPGAPATTNVPGAPGAPGVLDWRPLVRRVVHDMRRGVTPGAIAGRIHNAMVNAIVQQAEHTGCPRVALTGGCFQNRRLVATTAAALRGRGFTVLTHRLVPPNDGGIAMGQAVIAAARLGAPSDAGIAGTVVVPALTSTSIV